MNPMIGAALISAGGQLLGGLLGKSGQKEANQTNLQIARENRAWQEQMSNTAYQRATLDLEKAGLNRILALGKPASTPAGNIATFQNENAPLQQGILNASNVAANTALQLAQAKKINYEAEVIKPRASVYGKGGELINKSLDNLDTYDWGAMWDRFKTDAANAFEGIKKRFNELDAKSMIDQAKRDASSAKQTTRNAYSAAKAAIAASLAGTDVDPEKAERKLIQAVSEMDLPSMTDQEKLVWGVQNIERVQNYLKRRAR